MTTFPWFLPHLFGLFFGLIAVLLLVVVFVRPRPRTHGAARWARARDINALISGNGPIIGRDEKGRLLRAPGDAPLLTAAPARSGKGSGFIIPTLLTYPGSIVIIDPKGEAARVTREHRAATGKVFVVDPFAASISPESAARYNPLNALIGSPTMIEEAFKLADAICPVGTRENEHFSSTARTLIRAILLHVVTSAASDNQNLITVRAILNMRADAFTAELEEMAASELPAISGPARQQLARDPREGASVLSTAARATEWLDSPAVARSLTASDFSFHDLKSRAGTVYVVIPTPYMGAFGKWLRLLTVSVLSEFTRTPAPGSMGNCLFMIDEAAALGRLDELQTANAVMPGYGLRLWTFWQDLSQIEEAYGAAYQSFLASADTQIYFDVNDQMTCEEISGILGNETVVIGVGKNAQRTSRPLLAPELVRQEKRVIVFRRSQPPLRVRKIRWFADKAFKNFGKNER